MRAPRPVTCTPCGKRGVPLLRVWGYPTPAVERRADAGLVRLMGCLVPPSGLEDAAQWECRHCGAELLLPC